MDSTPTAKEIEPMFRPSDSFARRYGETLSLNGAIDLDAAVAINHDTHPDLVNLAASYALGEGRAVDYTEVATFTYQTVGMTFDAEGWIR